MGGVRCAAGFGGRGAQDGVGWGAGGSERDGCNLASALLDGGSGEHGLGRVGWGEGRSRSAFQADLAGGQADVRGRRRKLGCREPVDATDDCRAAALVMMKTFLAPSLPGVFSTSRLRSARVSWLLMRRRRMSWTSGLSDVTNGLLAWHRSLMLLARPLRSEYSTVKRLITSMPGPLFS